MTLNASTNIWKEIFQLIEQHPTLWNIKSPDFKNKMKKNQAWEVLLEKYKEIEPDANLTILKSKITNIKSCYRRELKKISDSIKSGAGEEDVHVPSLWYFHELNFLRDQDEAYESISPNNPTVKKTTSKRPPTDSNQEFLQQACLHLENMSRKEEHVEDEADVYAKSWAYSYRKLDAEQQLYAKKAIDDILILGQLKQLFLNTVSGPSPTYSKGSTPYSQQNRNFFMSSTSSPRTPSPLSSSPLQFAHFPSFPQGQDVRQTPPTKVFVVQKTENFTTEENEEN